MNKSIKIISRGQTSTKDRKEKPSFSTDHQEMIKYQVLKDMNVMRYIASQAESIRRVIGNGQIISSNLSS